MKTLKEMIEVMQAADQGKKIQSRPKLTFDWHDVANLGWDWLCCDYRIKPEPRRIWVNIYGERLGYKGCAYDNKKDAESAIQSNCETVEFIEVTK